MGVKSVTHEVKLKVSASRMFKAVVLEILEVIPKASTSIKSIHLLQGHGLAPGSIFQTNFPEGGYFTYLKERVDAVDSENYVCKYTAFEGDVLGDKLLGDKLEKICNELKIEETGDGGCVVKVKIDYHTKGDKELSDDEIKAGNEQVVLVYKECEDYLLANPHVCV